VGEAVSDEDGDRDGLVVKEQDVSLRVLQIPNFILEDQRGQEGEGDYI
jgi:hypothetical protein